MDIQDPSTWTKDFVISHRSECIRFLQETNDLSISYIRQKNYTAAVVGLNMIMNGLTVMQDSGCGDFRSHISMFSMVGGTLVACCMEGQEDQLRETAAAAFADARDFAKNDRTKHNMEELLSQLRSGVPLSQWREEYNEEENIGILQGLNEQLEKEISVSTASVTTVRENFGAPTLQSPNGQFEREIPGSTPSVTTVRGDSGKSFFDGKTLQLIGWSILASLLTGITLGLAFPWAYCMIERWKAKHTEINGRRLKFNGRGHQLFGWFILWSLLTIITFGIYGIWFGLGLKKWMVKHTVYADDTGEFESRFTGKAGGWFIQHLIAVLITMGTLGIGRPWAEARLLRWEAKNTVIGGSPLIFEGTGGQLFVNYLLAAIFTPLTLGIYALYFPIKLLKWQYSNTKALYRTEKIRERSLEHEAVANKDFAKYSIAANDAELRVFKSGIDGTQSEERLEELANNGNPYAQYQLAVKLKGENDRFDGRSLELLESSAGAGYYKALLDYAVHNMDQKVRYRELLEDAAKAGSSEAPWRLAEYYKAAAYERDGGRSAESLALFKQAAYWFKIAIEQEYPMAMASRLDYAVLIDRIALLEAGAVGEQIARKNSSAGAVVAVVAVIAVMAAIGAVIGWRLIQVDLIPYRWHYSNSEKPVNSWDNSVSDKNKDPFVDPYDTETSAPEETDAVTTAGETHFTSTGTPETETASPATETYYVSTELGLRLRSGPSTDFDIIVEMPYKSVVEVYEIKDGWAYGKYLDNIGYCSAEYLAKGDGR